MTSRSGRVRTHPHPFQRDPGVPPDPLDPEQRGACLHCHLVGKPGDAHHTIPAPTADVASLAAGEKED